MRVFKRSKRSFLPSGSDALEGRLLPSSIGHPMPTPPTPPVAASPHLGREAILTSRTPAHPSDRLAKPRCVTASHAAVSPSVKRWSWLAGSYWYVPSRNLPAVIFDGSKGTLIPVSDQTVFQITGYREGYFWGKSVTEVDSSSSVSGKSLVASVTPQGRVLLTFSLTSSGSSSSVIYGYGTMQRKDGRWTMANQTFPSSSQGSLFGHWAYMVQTHPGLPSWNSLPGAGISVPAFLNQVDGTGPEPIGP